MEHGQEWIEGLGIDAHAHKCGLRAPVRLRARQLAPGPRQVLVKALAETLADPATRAELEKVGIDVAYAPPPAYELRVNQELPMVRAYVQRAKISAE